MPTEGTANKIYSLRKNNQLTEAYILGEKAIRLNHNNQNIKGAFSWILYDYLKESSNDILRFKRVLDEINNYNFEGDIHNIFWKNVIIQIRIFGWNLIKSKQFDQLIQLFQSVSKLIVEDTNYPELSSLYRMFFFGLKSDQMKVKDIGRINIDLIRWFGFNRFTDKDYQESESKGKLYPSIVAQSLDLYLKTLLQYKPNGTSLATKEEIEYGIFYGEKIVNQGQSSKWALYYLGQLFWKSGDMSSALKYYLPYARENDRQAYVWERLGDFYLGHSNELYYSCIFKGLTLSKDPKYTPTLRKAAIDYFINIAGDHSAAKYEVDLLKNTWEKNKWAIDDIVENYTKQEWYENTTANIINDDLYIILSKEADSLLYGDIEPVDFYVEWVDKNKNLAGVVPNIGELEKERLTLKRDDLGIILTEGEAYTGVLYTEGRPRLIGIPEISINKEFREKYLKSVTGIFEKIKAFGFIRAENEGYYVRPSIVKEYNLNSFAKITGLAGLMFNSQKERWGWEIKRIEDVQLLPSEEYQKNIEGRIRITRKGFGFVEDVYIPNKLIMDYQIDQNDYIIIKANKSWNNKKNEWSWTGIELLAIEVKKET